MLGSPLSHAISTFHALLSLVPSPTRPAAAASSGRGTTPPDRLVARCEGCGRWRDDGCREGCGEGGQVEMQGLGAASPEEGGRLGGGVPVEAMMLRGEVLAAGHPVDKSQRQSLKVILDSGSFFSCYIKRQQVLQNSGESSMTLKVAPLRRHLYYKGISQSGCSGPAYLLLDHGFDSDGESHQPTTSI